MEKYLAIVYAAINYLLFLIAFVTFILFMNNALLAQTVDSVSKPDAYSFALLFNFSLLLLFCTVHGVTSRHGFKTRLSRYIPRELTQTTSVLLASAALLVMCRFWQPVLPVLWNIEDPFLRFFVQTGFWSGVLMMVVGSLSGKHLAQTGILQALRFARGQQSGTEAFRPAFLHRIVRHPVQLGLLVVLWAAPTMTLSHLFLSLSLTCYLFFALEQREREMIAAIGTEFLAYRARVPMLLPWGRSPSRQPVMFEYDSSDGLTLDTGSL